MQTQYRRRGALHVTPRSDRRKTWSRTSTSVAAANGHSPAQTAAGGSSWADGGSMADAGAAAAAVSPAAGGEGGLAELEGPAGEVLKDARAAGCEHGMLWAVTDSALHVMSAYDVAAGPGSACPDQPVVRASVPLSQLIGDRPCPGEVAATVVVLFPFVFTMHPATATPTAPLCVVLVGSLSKVLLVSLSGDGAVVSLNEGGGVPPELFDSPFTAACSVLQRGVAVANDVGETFYVEVNPTAFNFNRQGVCILSKMQDQGGLLSSILSYAAGPTAAVSRLFFGGGGSSRPQGDAGGDARAGRSPIVALLCNPVGGGGDAQSVFIVSKTGRVVQCTIGEEDEGEEAAGYTPPAAAGGRVVSEGLSSFVEDGAVGAEVAAACLSFPPGSLSVARLNLLVCYADAAGQTTLALARISCTAPTPIYKRAVVLQEGGVAAARYRLFLEDSDAAAQERVVLVSRGDGNTHITKIPIKHWAARGCYTGCEDEDEDPNAMADDDAAAALAPDSRVVPGYCVAVSESTCPLPERVVVATTAGSYGTEPLSSLCFSAMRRELCAGGTVASEPAAAAAAAAAAALPVSPLAAAVSPLAAAASPLQGAGGCSSASSVSGAGGEESALLQLLNGDLGVSSTAVVDEAVVDATQWTALTDAHDRASHMLLSKVRVKLDKAEFILEAAKKRSGGGGVGSDTFCTVADNYEKAAVSLALRELQSRLYTDVSAGKWQAAELARLISDHSTSRAADTAAAAASQQHADLHLTPLQTFYTETRRVGGFFAYLEGQMAEKAAAAASVAAEQEAGSADEGCGGGSLGYTAFCARLLSHVLDRLEPAKSYAASLPENQLAAAAGAGAAPASPAGVAGCRAEQGLYDALQRRRLVTGRWTHDAALLDALRGIATHLHAAACATTAAVAASELRRRRLQAVPATAPAAEVAAAEAAAEEENLRAAVLSTLKRVVRFVATQEVEALAASLGGAPLDAAAARALRELRRAHAAWTTEVFGLGGVVDAAASADSVETLRAVTSSEPYLLARDLGRELPDFVLLVRLAHMVPDARRRTEELRATLRHSPALFFEAVVAFYLAERPGRAFAGLLELPATLGLSEDELATMRAVAQADIPDDFAKKPAAVGPVVAAAGEDEDAAAAGAALLRGAAAAATLASANATLTVAQRLAKLKAAKFSCLAAAASASATASNPHSTSAASTAAAASSPELDAVTAHITLLKVHQHILRCASPHPHTAEKLFSKLVAGPVEGGAKWETAALADCVEGTVGHSLAWAFPLIPMLKASAANEQACRTEVWVKALTTPKGWWEAKEYAGILDKSEPEQFDLLSKTHLFAVLRTADAHPQVASAAHRGDRGSTTELLLAKKPPTMPVNLLNLLIEYAAHGAAQRS